MRNPAKQIDLVGNLSLDEDFLRCVSFLRGKDVVGFGGGDEEGTRDGREFGFVNEARDGAMSGCCNGIQGKGGKRDIRWMSSISNGEAFTSC